MTMNNGNGTGVLTAPGALALDQKVEALEAINSSVVGDAHPEQDAIAPPFGPTALLLYTAAVAGETLSPWGARPQMRDIQLRAFWHTEPFLAGTIGSMALRNSALHWKITGEPRSSEAAALVLQNANLGNGWEDFCIRVSIDLLTQDKGAFVEIVRVRDSETAPVIGINHLDANRCYPTGDPLAPVVYEDADGKYHRLKWYQVVQLLEMPAPVTYAREGAFWRIQYCAVTRMLRAAQIVKSIGIYNEEKITGRFTKGIHLISGVTTTEVETALRDNQVKNDQMGLMRYEALPPIVGSIDRKATVETAYLPLAGLPDNWDEEKAYKWYLTIMALCFGADYQDLAPLPGGGLGSGQQSEVLHRKSRGKGQAFWMQMIARLLNLHGILPRNTQFEWDEDDPEADKTLAEVQKLRADARKTRLDSGELLPEIAWQIALEVGDLTEDQYNELVRLAAQRKAEEEAAAREQVALQQQAAAATPNAGASEGEDRTPASGGTSRASGGDRGSAPGEDRTAGGKDEQAMTVIEPTRETKALMPVPFGTLIASRLHRMYAQTADDVNGLGYFNTLDDRLAVGSAIGPALATFEDLLREAGVWDILIRPEDADRLIGAALKLWSAKEDRAGPDQARLEFEDEVAGEVLKGFAEAKRLFQARLRDLAAEQPAGIVVGTREAEPVEREITRRFEYDPAGRIIRILYPGVKAQEVEWDGDRPVEVRDVPLSTDEAEGVAVA